MASTYTTNIGIEKPATGDQSGTWGDTTNTNFDIIDQGTNGVAVVTLASAGTSGSPNSLPISNGALSDGRNRFIEFNDGGDLGATAYVQLDPNDAEKIVHIRNSLSASRGLILFQGTYNASNDFIVPNGADVLVKFNGGGTGATVTDVNANLAVSQLSLIDGNKAVFGSGSDLQIYHDGSHSRIADAGTGDLKIGTSGGAVRITANGVTDDMIVANQGGSVSLSHSGSTKLATTSFGAQVTGSLAVDTITNATASTDVTIDTNFNIILDGANVGINASSPTLTGFGSGTNGLEIADATLAGIRLNGNAADSLYFVSGSSKHWIYGKGAVPLTFSTNASERMRIDSSGNVGIGSTSPATKLEVAGAVSSTGTGAGNAAFKLQEASNNPWYLMQFTGGAFSLNYNGTTGGASTLLVDSSGNVGIGTTSPASDAGLSKVVEIEAATAGFKATATGGSSVEVYSASAASYVDTTTNHPIVFRPNKSERMRINTNGNVGINRTPSYELDVGASDNAGSEIRIIAGSDSGADAVLRIQCTATAGTRDSAIYFGDSANTSIGRITYGHSNDDMRFFTNGAEKMRLNNVGRWWVGQAIGTILNGNGGEAKTGMMHYSNDQNSFTTIQSNGSNSPLYVTNGPDRSGTGLIQFGDNGSNVGAIGDAGGRIFFADNNQNMGISFFASCLLPTNINGLAVDNFYDCGHPSYRWDDIRATNGTIQTSDANEKQQIAALTNAEITAAKAISVLFKTFKWNSAVEAKGDAARTHAGVIAQDVQAAMTAAGLDAGDYAFFIIDTWWETQTEVPAVEAVEAVDAVYEDVVIPAVEEELDEEGNVIVEAQPERIESRLVSEAIVPVEAVDAYTRTDTYDTAEEAPEGATERTRMGIRYPELLAFVGAATEQRLANIETRLAALEAN